MEARSGAIPADDRSCAYGAVECVDEEVDVVPREGQLRADLQNVRFLAGRADEHATLAQLVDDADGLLRVGLSGSVGGDEVDAEEETRASDVADAFVFRQ